MIPDFQKGEFILISEDRHRDDIAYSFKGTYLEAKEKARELLYEMRSYDYDEYEHREDYETLLYSINMLDGDYKVSVYLPEELKPSEKNTNTEKLE